MNFVQITDFIWWHATFTVFLLNIAFIAVHSGERCGPWDWFCVCNCVCVCAGGGGGKQGGKHFQLRLDPLVNPCLSYSMLILKSGCLR